MMKGKFLIVIPARGGSKGIPRKNVKFLNGKPLIYYTIDVARAISKDCDICVSTDDQEIKEVVEQYGLDVPFLRPSHLATDTATTNEVLLHAISFYESIGIYYNFIVLLQPTSPLRLVSHLKQAISQYHNMLDMVVSVRESHAAAVLCQENENGYLENCFNEKGFRRQDITAFYEYDGSIYIINIESLKNKGLAGLQKKKKFVIPFENSIDIDTPFDWLIAEKLLSRDLLIE